MNSLVWKIYAVLVGTVTTIAATKAIGKVWEVVYGEEPPEPGDPDTPIHLAVIWSAASAIGVGTAQLVANRGVLKRARKALNDTTLKKI